MPMAATYLAWVDFSATGLPEAEVARRLREDATAGTDIVTT
jgi:bifunctional pyridoxal-dependent enzyme with beta-cystathionase and maltose regulon repressor activities